MLVRITNEVAVAATAAAAAIAAAWRRSIRPVSFIVFDRVTVNLTNELLGSILSLFLAARRHCHE
jgi:hypothetical protein